MYKSNNSIVTVVYVCDKEIIWSLLFFFLLFRLGTKQCETKPKTVLRLIP